MSCRGIEHVPGGTGVRWVLVLRGNGEVSFTGGSLVTLRKFSISLKYS